MGNIKKISKKVLFITYDLSGYYESVHQELLSRYTEVDFYNTSRINFKYKNLWQRIVSATYKSFTGKRFKNFYKYKPLIKDINSKSYDITLIVRPDVFFDAHLEIIRKRSTLMIAYYHDSINNIARKKEVLCFFDEIYSYEKKDVADYNLKFLSNFNYLGMPEETSLPVQEGFSVMSYDYRLPVLRKIADIFAEKDKSFKFCVMSKKKHEACHITFIDTRMDNPGILDELKRSKIMIDVHKFGIQDGLTFRVFEAMALKKKLITVNKDIKTYDFYNPNNIFVIEDIENIYIPDDFFMTPYENLPDEVIKKYNVQSWVDRILSNSA